MIPQRRRVPASIEKGDNMDYLCFDIIDQFIMTVHNQASEILQTSGQKRFKFSHIGIICQP